MSDAAIEARTQEIGRELIDAARAHPGGRGWSDRLMEWASSDPGFKTQLFRFIDVFPTLRTPEQVHAHLVEYLTLPGVNLPAGLGLGIKAGGLMKGLSSKAIAAQIESMAGRFIAGVDATEALPRLRVMWDAGLAFSVDLLGEACVSEAEAQAYERRYLDLLAVLPGEVAAWPGHDVLDGERRCNLSVKVSALSRRADALAWDRSLDALTQRMLPILDAAHRAGAFVNFDMEHHALKELTIALFERCAQRVETPMGIALQAYLRSGDDDAKRLIAWSKKLGRAVTVRLVKGAYWDYETIHARLMGWPSPVWSHKAQTDACFERMTRALIDGGVTLAVGSHNARSLAHALAYAEARGVALPEVQMLHGMADPLKAACVHFRERGLRVREYVPLGQMIPGMAYLVRRLLENTSNESWLRAGFGEGQPVEALLMPPQATLQAPTARTEGFINEPVRDFADASQREAFAHAVGSAQPAGVAVDAGVEDGRAAVERAAEAFRGWRTSPVIERATILRKTAAAMRRQRDALAAMVLREAHKPWRDADADVCEAIDFCEYYAQQAMSLFEPVQHGHRAGEWNLTLHEPRGVAAIIAPWNFPLAICTGMTVAALATGNCAIVKPAEQTPAMALRMCELLWQAGVPRDVLQLLPGEGETVGAALVRDPRVALICFTGSMAVGVDILTAAAATSSLGVKRVVCELGGKNAIIVDSSADLDEAVLGVRDSAFGYAGQKCSACSRVIVLDDIHDAFVARLVEASRALVVGDPADPATDVPPLIDDDARDKVRRYIDLARTEGTLVLPDTSQPTADTRLIPPHIVTGIGPHHRLATEEIFGPVLAVLRARNFAEALAIANSSGYRLTGGVYSRTPSHLDASRRDLLVGNLYLNRRITGALVGRQPFGGFGLSGVGSQAGGPGYLQQFVVPRTICENTMRRGFAPET